MSTPTQRRRPAAASAPVGHGIGAGPVPHASGAGALRRVERADAAVRCIYAANHTGFMDGPLVFGLAPAAGALHGQAGDVPRAGRLADHQRSGRSRSTGQRRPTATRCTAALAVLRARRLRRDLPRGPPRARRCGGGQRGGGLAGADVAALPSSRWRCLGTRRTGSVDQWRSRRRCAGWPSCSARRSQLRPPAPACPRAQAMADADRGPAAAAVGPRRSTPSERLEPAPAHRRPDRRLVTRRRRRRTVRAEPTTTGGREPARRARGVRARRRGPRAARTPATTSTIASTAGPAAGARRRRPPERRQVHAGQPHPRPPRGRRRGRARRHARPRHLRGRLGRPPVHARRHRRLGARRRRASRRGSPSRPRSRSSWPTPCCSSSTPPSARPTPTRPSSGCCAGPASRSCSPPTRSTTRAPRPTPRRCGPSGSASRYPVSALHGRGSGDLLDAALAVLPEVSAGRRRRTPRAARAAWRCSAGRTSASRACSTSSPARSASSSTRSPAPRATRSTSWSSSAGGTWRFVDTAGIRRRVHQTRGADFYASLRTQAALEKAEVAVVLVDAQTPITEQDMRVIQEVIEAGRALVIAYNKWDLLDEERRHYLEREIEQDLVQVPWAPRVNISARTGRHLDRLVPALDLALASWDTRIPTGRLNAFLGELVAGAPAPAARRQAAAHPVRHPGRHPAAAVRAVRHRLPRGRLPPVHRAPAARGVRLRGHADRGQRAGPREARRADRGNGSPGAGRSAVTFRCSREGRIPGCGAAW